ncbi:MAG: lipid II-degrading bacteriocin [Egibacteraceae bacterium]
MSTRTGTRVAAEPDRLEAYTEATSRTLGPTRGSLDDYTAAIRAFLSAGPNDVGTAGVGDRGRRLGDILDGLAELDAKPAAFAFALRQLDRSGAEQLSTVDTRMFEALVTARAVMPFAAPEDVHNHAVQIMAGQPAAHTGQVPNPSRQLVQADQQAADQIRDRSTLQRVGDFFGSLARGFVGAAKGAWNAVTGFFKDPGKAVVAEAGRKITGFVSGAVQAGKKAVNQVVEAGKDLAGKAAQAGKDFLGWLGRQASKVGNWIIDKFKSALNAIVSWLKSQINAFLQSLAAFGGEIVYRVFKACYSHYLPRQFIDHYYSGSGDAKHLSPKEMIDCNPEIDLPRSIQGEIDSLKAAGGGSKHITGKGYGAALTNGTLGNFTVNYEGTLTVLPDGSWSFDGLVDFHDYWDFDPKPWGKRSWYAEALTRIGTFLPGKPFNITSERIRVTQNSGDRQVKFPAFPGFTPTVAPSRVNSREGKEGGETEGEATEGVETEAG